MIHSLEIHNSFTDRPAARCMALFCYYDYNYDYDYDYDYLIIFLSYQN